MIARNAAVIPSLKHADAISLHIAYFVYFFCGMAQCFESVFLPEFKAWFHLGYQQQMYIMLAKNSPFVLAGAIAILLPRAGYKRCFNAAIFLYAAGTVLLVPALQEGQFFMLLAGFLLIGIGFNFQLVAGNPLIIALGSCASSSSRLNLANALGAVAQIIAPAMLSFLIPAVAVSVPARLPYMEKLFSLLAAVLLLIMLLTFLMKDPQPVQIAGHTTRAKLPPKVWWGFAAIVLALGAEASLFGFFRNYLEEPRLGGLSPTESQLLFTIFLSLFAAGRLLAAWAQRRFSPVAHLAVNLTAAILSMTLLLFMHGVASVIVFTAMGFWVASFFPTIYAIAIEGLGELTAAASGLLTMGFLGCAFFPVLQGRLADAVGLQRSFVLCISAYALILLYTLSRRLADDGTRAS